MNPSLTALRTALDRVAAMGLTTAPASAFAPFDLDLYHAIARGCAIVNPITRPPDLDRYSVDYLAERLSAIATWYTIHPLEASK